MVKITPYELLKCIHGSHIHHYAGLATRECQGPEDTYMLTGDLPLRYDQLTTLSCLSQEGQGRCSSRAMLT